MKKLAYIFIFLFSFACFSGCNLNSNSIEKLSANKSCYTINATFNNLDKSLSVDEEIKYVNNSKDTLKSVYFHIYPKAFTEGVINKPVSALNEAKAYPNGKSYGTFNLNSLQVSSEDVEQKYTGDDKDILVVDLHEDLKPNKSVIINIKFSVELPNIHHRFGYGENTINLGNFYLIACVYEDGKFNTSPYHYNGDPFYSNMANYNVTLTYDKSLTLASTGSFVAESEKDDLKTTCYKADGVRDFAMVLSDKFKMISEKIDNIMVNYFYYLDKNPTKSLQASIDSIRTFNELFGKYPYKVLNVCETNFVYGGMEYPNLVYISDDLENYEDYIHTIVHEIAHQWWYSVVGNDEFKYGFLDEGLTEFSTYLFYDENPQYNMNTEEMIKNTTNSYLLFLDVYKEVFGKVDTTMLRSLDEYNTEPEYIYMSYVKGTLMFDSLKKVVGTTKFIKSLKHYYKTNFGENVAPKNLIDAFNKCCGQNLESFFNSWFNGNVVIENM